MLDMLQSIKFTNAVDAKLLLLLIPILRDNVHFRWYNIVHAGTCSILIYVSSKTECHPKFIK